MYGEMPYYFIMTTATRRTSGHELKTERLELRVAPSVRKVIEHATAVSGLAAGDLAFEGARRVLEDHERLVLRGADQEAFLKAVASPPRPTARLISALRKHAKLKG